MNVLIVEGGTTASAMQTALCRRGHSVLTALTVEAALAHEAPDVLVAETELPDGSGIELLAQLRERGDEPRAVFVAARPTIDDCRRALLLGASDFLTKPFRLEELVRAVESALPEERCTPRVEGFERAYGTSDEELGRAIRAVVGHLVTLGIGPSCRARIASAATELFDNVRRHAYIDPRGTDAFCVSIVNDDRSVIVKVEDWGTGFDAGDVSEHAFQNTLHNGFARVACLAEDVQLDSRIGRGSVITMQFAAYQVHFDEDGHVDLTELDFLTPDLSRCVLETLADGSGDDPYRLSPALAVAVGRLLAGPDTRKRLQLALWS